MKKKNPNRKKLELTTGIELIFDSNKISSAWYHPKLAKVLCSVCDKDCKGTLCVNTNPYCG